VIDGGLEVTFGTFGRGCGMFHRFMQVHARQAFSAKTTTQETRLLHVSGCAGCQWFCAGER
jgi:hypothetical protein